MSARCPRCLQKLAANTVHDTQADCDTAMGPRALVESGADHSEIIPRGMSEADHAQLLMVPVALIDVEANVRADLGDLGGLAASIGVRGVIQPITVHAVGERFVVDMGHRRLAATKLAGQMLIPAIVTSDHAEGPVRSVLQLVENIQRQDLNPLEEAQAFRAILDADPELTQARLAERVGKAPTTVSNALRLLELEPEVRALVEAGTLSAAHAKALVGVSPTRQKVLAASVAADRVSSHSLEQQIAHERQLAESDETKAARTARIIPKLIEALEKAGVPKGAPLDVVIYQWETTDSTAICKAVKAAGYNETNGMTLSARPERGECDCVAFRAEVTGRANKIVPACTDSRHMDRQRNLEHLENKATRDEAEAKLAGQVAAIAAELDQVHISLPLLRMIASLTTYGFSNDCAGMDAEAAAQKLLDNLTVEWRLRNWGELGMLDFIAPPAAEPVSAAEAAERVATKRAARRAELIQGLQTSGQQPGAIAAAVGAFDDENPA